MRHLLSCAAAAFALVTAVPAGSYAAETYVLDPAHTNIYWASSHMGFSTVSGKFADPEGKIVLDDAAPEKSTVEVTVHTDKILTGVPKFDDHLRSKDFFDSAQFPTATFKSKKVEKTGQDTAKVTGDFTLRGITKELTLDVKLNKRGENPFTKSQTVGFGAKGVFKRSDFGITYGAPAVPDQVALHIQTEATKEEAAAAPAEAAKAPAADAHAPAEAAKGHEADAKAPAADAHAPAEAAKGHEADAKAPAADAHAPAEAAKGHEADVKAPAADAKAPAEGAHH